MAGKFITFEGGEGAGKSTQILRLADRLRLKGLTATVTREPGGTPAAEAIRDMILSGAASRFGPDGEAMLFAAARADHVDRLIRPALVKGDWVLCDRFSDSTRVYQGVIGGVDEDLTARLERVAVGTTRPRLTIILDLPVADGLARAKRRMSEAGDTPDRFEREQPAVHEKGRQAFLDIARDEPERCVVVDAAGSEEEVADDIWRAVSARLLHQRQAARK